MEAGIAPVWFSDHHAMTVSFVLKGPNFGRGFWKMNVGILREVEFERGYKDMYAGWVALKPMFKSVVEWWEWVKQRTKKRQLQGYFVEGNLRRDCTWEGYRELQEKLRAALEERAKRFLFTARREFVEKNETCSSYFFNRAKEAKRRKVIKGLKGEGGSVQTGREEMMETVTKFYQELFRRREEGGRRGGGGGIFGIYGGSCSSRYSRGA